MQTTRRVKTGQYAFEKVQSVSTCALISMALFDLCLIFVKAGHSLKFIRPSQGEHPPKVHGASVVADPGQLKQKQTSKQLKA